MQPIEWNDKKMSIGVDIIDEQHKQLLLIINKLAYTIEEHSQKIKIVDIIDELIEYTQFHFLEEENFFNTSTYEHKELHIKEHMDFTHKVHEVKNDFFYHKSYEKKKSTEVAQELFIFLTNWFLNHILGIDKTLAIQLKKN